MRKVICGLLILGSLFAVVGCSSGGDANPTPTATVKTPIQLLNESTSARFTAVWELINGHTTSITNLGNRVGTLEGQSSPDVTALTTSLAALTTRVSGLESLNISDELSDILAEIAYIKLQLSPTPTPVGATPTPVGATPTPTPTPVCSVTKPSNPYPADGATGITENNIELKWSDCNATTYMLYVGVNSSTTTTLVYNGAFTRYYYDSLLPNTYYYWKVIAIAPLGCVDQVSSWSFRTQ